MIIWKGYGILVPVIVLAIGALLSTAFPSMGYTKEMGAAVGAILSGIAIWYAGIKFNDPEKARTFIDKESGQEFTFKPDHSLFFIKMQYWAFIVGGAGLVMLTGILMNGKSPF